MKKIIITLSLVALAAISYGSDGDTLTKTFKKVVVTKPTGKDTALVVTYTITTVDTVKRVDYKAQIDRYQQALQSGKESIAIQQKLNAYYQAEIDRLKLLKKKTD